MAKHDPNTIARRAIANNGALSFIDSLELAACEAVTKMSHARPSRARPATAAGSNPMSDIRIIAATLAERKEKP